MTIAELNEVRDLRAELNRELDRQRSLEDAINSLTSLIDGLPRSHNSTSRTERLATLLVDTSEIIRDLNERIITATVALTEKIFRTDLSNVERDILIQRYVKCLSFKRVASEINLSIDYIFRLHRSALKKTVR